MLGLKTPIGQGSKAELLFYEPRGSCLGKLLSGHRCHRLFPRTVLSSVFSCSYTFFIMPALCFEKVMRLLGLSGNKDKIAGWRFKLDKILHVFSMRSVTSMTNGLSLHVPF